MKNPLLYLIASCIVGFSAITSSFANDSVAVTRRLPFGLGESLEYHVRYGFIPAGKARIAILDTVRVRGQLCYHGVSQARSAKGFDPIFRVRDKIETWFDFDSLLVASDGLVVVALTLGQHP